MHVRVKVSTGCPLLLANQKYILEQGQSVAWDSGDTWMAMEHKLVTPYQIFHMTLWQFKIKDVFIFIQSFFFGCLGNTNKPSLQTPLYHHLCCWFTIAMHTHTHTHTELSTFTEKIALMLHYLSAMEFNVLSFNFSALARGEYAITAMPWSWQ